MDKYLCQCINQYHRASKQVSSYLETLPKDTTKTVLNSFATSFAVGTVINANPVAGVVCGAVAGLAAFIHVAVKPLFEKIATNQQGHKTLEWYQQLVRTITVITLTSLATGLVLSVRINLLFSVMFCGALMWAEGKNHFPLETPQMYIIV